MSDYRTGMAEAFFRSKLLTKESDATRTSGVKFPRSPGLAECWGFTRSTAANVHGLASQIFPSQPNRCVGVLGSIMAFNDEKAYAKTGSASSWSRRDVQEGGNHLTRLASVALRVLLDKGGDPEAAEHMLQAMVTMRPDVFTSNIAGKYRIGSREEAALVAPYLPPRTQIAEDRKGGWAYIPLAPSQAFDW